MRKIISLFLIVLVTVGLVMSDAQAKRFGGGRSFGVQRTMSHYTRPQPLQSAAQRATSNRWFGPIAGLITGGLLASLFMGHGLGTGLVSWLAIGLVVLAIFSLLRGRLPKLIPNQYNQQDNQHGRNSFANDTNAYQYAPVQEAANFPLGFDEKIFLRDAKVQFIRLQAAYDQKDLSDLRQFTTPEVFGEIQLQIQERGEASNHTEVVTLNAELLNVDSQAREASVAFSGMIRENPNSEPESFNEIWHFHKDLAKSQWVCAGIQQQ